MRYLEIHPLVTQVQIQVSQKGKFEQVECSGDSSPIEITQNISARKRGADQEERRYPMQEGCSVNRGNNLACKNGSEQGLKEDVFAALPTELQSLTSFGEIGWIRTNDQPITSR